MFVFQRGRSGDGNLVWQPYPQPSVSRFFFFCIMFRRLMLKTRCFVCRDIPVCHRLPVPLGTCCICSLLWGHIDWQKPSKPAMPSFVLTSAGADKMAGSRWHKASI